MCQKSNFLADFACDSLDETLLQSLVALQLLYKVLKVLWCFHRLAQKCNFVHYFAFIVEDRSKKQLCSACNFVHDFALDVNQKHSFSAIVELLVLRSLENTV